MTQHIQHKFENAWHCCAPILHNDVVWKHTQKQQHMTLHDLSVNLLWLSINNPRFIWLCQIFQVRALHHSTEKDWIQREPLLQLLVLGIKAPGSGFNGIARHLPLAVALELSCFLVETRRNQANFFFLHHCQDTQFHQASAADRLCVDQLMLS